MAVILVVVVAVVVAIITATTSFTFAIIIITTAAIAAVLVFTVCHLRENSNCSAKSMTMLFLHLVYQLLKMLHEAAATTTALR